MLRQTLAERLEKHTSPEPNSGCWLWTGYIHNGYGLISVDGRVVRAHRASYEVNVGKIPPRMHVLHKCDLPCCINPEHLFVGTHQDNMLDMLQKGRNKVFKGEENKTAKLTEKDVMAIRDNSEDIVLIAKKFNVSARTIQQIQRRETWRHV